MASTPAEILAAEIADLKRRVSDMERTAQLTRSTVIDESGREMTVLDGLRAGWNAQASAATAITAATEARAKADGAVVTFFGPEEPPLTGNTAAKPGDLWRQSGGEVFQVNAAGTEWVQVSVNSDLSDALDELSILESTIDGKLTTYYFPSGTPPYEPDDGDLWIVPDLGNQVRRYDGDTEEWIPLRAGSDAIEDFAITAAKLEANLVLGSRIIAGSPTGKRAEMNPDGFYVYIPDGDGVREVARLGVAGENDKLAVTQSGGDQVASISEDGVMSGVQVNSESVYYKGEELDRILDTRPRGIVAWGRRDTHQTSLAYVNRAPYLRVDAVLEPGRQYHVYTNPMVTVTNNSGSYVHLGYKVGEQATVYNDIGLHRARITGDWGQVVVESLFTLPAGATSNTVSFLVSVVGASSSQYAGLYCESDKPGYLIIEDIGPATIPESGVHLNNTNDTAPLTDRHVLTLPHIRNVSYNADTGIAFDTSGTTYGTQWVGKTGSTAEHVAYFGFADATATLSGRTVLSARLLVPMRMWAHPSGQDSLAISVHGVSGMQLAPSEMPDISNPSAWAYNVAAPSSRWVTLPSALHAGLKSGTVRGVLLHRPAGRTAPYDDTDYYGVFDLRQGDATHAASTVVLEITYR